MVKLSVITPSYNSERFIEHCIKNVIEQECVEIIEHIIIDGASTDQTIEIIKKHAEQYPHIIWISEKDTGQSNAMNKGIRVARGEYISFLNVDDYYSKNTLKEILQIISSPSSPSFIVGNCNVWDNKDNLIYINKPVKITPWHMMAGIYLPVNPSAYFYQKSIHETGGFYNENNHYNMDLEFILKTSFNFQITYCNKDWGNFRLLPESKTGSDMTTNQLEKRKQELFQKYFNHSPFLIKLKVILLRVRKRVEKLFYTLKKAVLLPFDIIYWKLRKSFK